MTLKTILPSLFIIFLVSLYLMFGYSNSEWIIIAQKTDSRVIGGFSQVVFIDKLRGFAVAGGDLMKTSDGGKTWENSFKDETVDKSIQFISIKNEKDLVIVGKEITESKEISDKTTSAPRISKSLMLQSADAGISWQKIQTNEMLPANGERKLTAFGAACFDGSGKIWLMDDNGIVSANIEDNKLTEANAVFSKESSKLSSIACGRQEDIWVTDSEKFFHYQNGELKEVSTGAEGCSDKVKITGDEIWLIGESATKTCLYKSKDSGKTWEDKSFSDGLTVTDISFTGNTGWLIGAKKIKAENGAETEYKSKIYYSNDKGENWVEKKNPTNKILSNMFFLDSRNGWIVGESYTVLKYEN